MMMKAVRSSSTSVNTYQTTRRNIPEEIHLHTRRRKNLKPHEPNNVIKRSALPLTWEACRCNIQTETSYKYLGFSLFSSLPLGKCGYSTLK
jgi:hypothetical protein